MLLDLRMAVLEANLELNRRGVVLYTWGNVSAIDRDKGLIAIKPSGVDYDVMTVDDIVVVDLDNTVVWGDRKPSSDTRTHTALYRAFPTIGGVAHTHSTNAVAWAQARRAIPCLGTTQADYCAGEVPCTAPLPPEEVRRDYETATGDAIIRRFQGLDPVAVPMVLVAGHGPFTWGTSAADAVHNAVVLEECAMMALHTRLLNPGQTRLDQHLLDKHYLRKHGKNYYYGQ